MKDIYIIMNRQNILNFYGSKFNLKLDSSELYDFELGKTIVDYNTDVLDLTNEITYTGLTIDSSCYSGFTTPWALPINELYTGHTCDFTIKRRTEKGWTLDFVFDRNNIGWSGGTTFYYWGISGETNQSYYADNNLSFKFTNDGRIKWNSYRYSGNCDATSGYTESYYISSGQTPVLCSGGTSSDFNVTITFDRYKHYQDCDIENEGGWNDLIRGPHPISSTGNTGSTTTQITTGYTIINNYTDWVTGATGTTEFIEVLNKKWFNERQKRLGVLKIYLNGKRIYKLDDWEEVIPSLRNSENDIIQKWGGGTTAYNTIHTGTTLFQIKQVKYFEEPLDFIHVNHHYLTSIKPNYSINECSDDCVDTIIGLITPTPTITPSVTPTPTITPSVTPTLTITPSVTPTLTVTSSVTPTRTVTPTPSVTPTRTVTPTPSVTASITPTPTVTPTATPVSLGFQWMTINSVTDSTASGTGQNGITVSITQSGGGMQVESPGMYSASTFPQEYDVPSTGTQIRNTKNGLFTATFSQPVTNPLIAFASVGRPNLSVPVQSTLPFTPIWSTATTYQNPVNGSQYTQFTGREGFNIIRIDGTVSSVSFNYTVTEFYCTVCFGFVDQNTLPTPTPTPTNTPTLT